MNFFFHRNVYFAFNCNLCYEYRRVEILDEAIKVATIITVATEKYANETLYNCLPHFELHWQIKRNVQSAR